MYQWVEKMALLFTNGLGDQRFNPSLSHTKELKKKEDI